MQGIFEVIASFFQLIFIWLNPDAKRTKNGRIYSDVAGFILLLILALIIFILVVRYTK